MESLCLRTQESIAWGRYLTAEDHQHLKACTHCTSLHEEMQGIDAMLAASICVEPSVDFADRVMIRIDLESGKESLLDTAVRRSAFLSQSPRFEVGFAAAGFALAAINLVNFVFSFAVSSAT